MKILQVINAFYPPYSGGGAAFVAHDISEALEKRGHEVTVYTTNVLGIGRLFNPKQNPSYHGGVRVYYFTNVIYKPSSHIYFSEELRENIKKNIANYDVIHVHEYRSYISLLVNHYARTRAKNGVPYILQAHGQLLRVMPKQGPKLVYDLFFGYRLLKEASKVIALSLAEAQQYSGMGVPKEKIEIIPNGIGLRNYANLPSKGLFKRKFCIPSEKKLILCLGRINKTKGLDFLVKTYAYLTKTGKCDNVFLAIAGPDDGYMRKLKQLINDLEISELILFTGLLSEKEKVRAYVDSDVVVNLEPRNVFSLVPLEAAACSTPAIVCKGNSVSEVVRQGKFGFAVKYGDISGLAETILRLLNNNFAREIGRNGRQYVFENFNWDKIAAKVEKVYNEIA